MIILGIESTAHTMGIGIIEDSGKNVRILSDARSVYVPEKGGIHPGEAREHHENAKKKVLEDAMNKAGVGSEDIDCVAYAAGPGLPPCLKTGMELAISLNKKLIPVNHAVAHIEIGRLLTKAKDPIVLYVSGGNTQVIGFAAGRWRVFGETLDIAVGNAIDTFAREIGLGFPGGPKIEQLAKKGNYVRLPYGVKGMDLSFSGILTAAIQLFRKGTSKEDLAFSFQEICYSMLAEVSERALAHTGKKELLLTGGVGASSRLTAMLGIMCSGRNASFFACPSEYTGDNGVNIAYTGFVAHKIFGEKAFTKKPDFIQKWRVDEVDWKI